MKRFSILTLIALLAWSCEGVIVYKDYVSEPVLIVNAMMDAADTTHLVKLAISDISEVDTIKNGSVQMYVNGVLVSEGDDLLRERDSYYRISTLHNFRCNAILHEGDKVKIVATANNGKFKASAESVVPSPGVVTSIDTSAVVKVEDVGWTHTYLRFNIGTRDVSSGDDYYFLTLVRHYHVKNYRDGVLISDTKSSLGEEFDCLEDIILSEEATVVNPEFTSIGSYNTCGVFTDRRFKNGEARLKIYGDKYQYSSYDLGGDAYRFQVEGSDSLDFTSTIDVRVNHISEEYYYYLKALNNLLGDTDDTGLFLEKTTMPSNINGGIGFFGIANSGGKEVLIEKKVVSLKE